MMERALFLSTEYTVEDLINMQVLPDSMRGQHIEDIQDYLDAAQTEEFDNAIYNGLTQVEAPRVVYTEVSFTVNLLDH